MYRAIVAVVTLACTIGFAARPIFADVAVATPSQNYTAWPITIDSSSGPIQVFQPQPESLEGNTLKARAAISLTAAGATEPVFGALWLTARIATDQDARTATILDLTVRRVRFPDVPDDQNAKFAQLLQQQVPSLNVTFSLDQLMTSLDVAVKEKTAVQDIQTTPPRIIFSPAPATLVLIDGQAQLQPVADQPGLLRVVNTPFAIILESTSRLFFLKAGNFWYSSQDVHGPWQNVGRVPANVVAVGNSLTAPPPPANGADAGAVAPPPGQQPNPGQIIVSEEPAELIATAGQPAYVPLPGNELLYVSNTQSDVFLDITSQQTYVLLSGRWYRVRTLEGPWEYVAADKLPAAFASIPENSPKSNVLASVAGTMAAKEARIEAQIPQTAAVDRSAGQSLAVTYDGEPRFEPIEQTTVSYCVNTPNAVLLFGGRYYCCHQAVWYDSAVAVGPWQVCVSVPDVIYTIPPSCPIYYVRYCHVYSYTPNVVYCGYLPGYTGCFVYGPTVVFGTGYRYHGWYHTEYYPRFYTFGFGVRYDHTVGAWGGGAFYRYDRNWFVRSGDHHGWWGPRGYVDYHSFAREDVRITNTTIVRNTTINRLNIYNRTDNVSRKVVINRDFVSRGEVGRGEAIRREQPREIASPQIHGRVENNVYAGEDGNVYRRTNAGWEQRSGKSWSQVKPEEHVVPHVEPARVERPGPSASPREIPRYAPQPQEQSPAHVYGGLEADHVARERGIDRSRSYDRPSANDRSPQQQPQGRPPQQQQGNDVQRGRR